MRLLLASLITFFFASSFTNYEVTFPSAEEMNGIWVHHRTDDQKERKSYLKVDGEYIQLYIETYWDSGANQFIGGEMTLAQNSLFIHVDNYLTISTNNGRIIKYDDCPRFRVQRLKIHDLMNEGLNLEIIPGSSIYDNFGFFEEKLMHFSKLEAKNSNIDLPIFGKINQSIQDKNYTLNNCQSIVVTD